MIAEKMTDSLIQLTHTMTEMGQSDAQEGKAPLRTESFKVLVGLIFISTPCFRDDPEWGSQMTATIADILMDNYMTGYNSIQ